MRRISLLNDAQAKSISNGIIFYPTLQDYVVSSTVDETGNISVNTIKLAEFKKIEKETALKEKNSKKIDNFTIWVFISYVFFIILIFRMPILIALVNFFRYFLLSIAGIITYSLNHTEKKTKKFHSAEHMIFNAYEDLERLPTLEELKEYSHFHDECGTNSMAFLMLEISAIIFCSYISNIALFFLISIGITLLLKILLDHGCFNFFQLLTTSPATDLELNVAIEGMKVWIELDAENQKSDNDL